MPKPILHTETDKRVQSVLKNMPQALIVTGRKGSGVSGVAHYLAETTCRTPLSVMPKKRMSGGTKFVVDTENGAILIEDIRQLYEQTRGSYTSPQVIVLDFYDRTMTTGAQNAFLKLLEEPQPNIHFILATHHPEQLLPTIRSRCQRLDIRPLTAAQTDTLLTQLGVTDTTKKTRIKFIAEGLADEAARLAGDEEYYDLRVTAVQDAKTILEGSSYAKLLVVRKYKDNRPLALQLIDDILLQLQKTLERSPDQRIIQQIDQLIKSHDVIQGNGNIQLQLTRVLL